jgi:NAD+ kinase
MSHIENTEGRKSVQFVLMSLPSSTKYRRARTIAKRIADGLSARGIVVDDHDTGRRYDLVIAVGGDGTIMHTARTQSFYGRPTLGVNGGDVGFLASAEGRDWQKVVDRVTNGQFVIENRLSLSGGTRDVEYDLVTNEVLLRHPSSIATFEVAIGESVLYQGLSADGLLVATATGSTAYNASVGGPIISPESPSVVLSAIAPTVLNHRPFVTDKVALGEMVAVTVVSSKENKPVSLILDGRTVGQGIMPGGTVYIAKGSKSLRMATFGMEQYLRALRTKKGFAT